MSFVYNCWKKVMELLKILVLVQLFGLSLVGYAQISDNCQTPEGTEGQCKLTMQCPFAAAIIREGSITPEDADYLRRSKCDSVGPKVCCPLEKISNRIKNNVGRPVDFCVTPRSEHGACKVITNCTVFRPIMQSKSISSEDASYIRGCKCGSEGRYPKVCCPFQVIPVSSSLLPSLDVCGIQRVNKIYGGTETDLKEYPWMALLQYQLNNGKRVFLCGGSLINKRYVLTAAHCMGIKELVNVRLGEHDIRTDPDCVEINNKQICNPASIDVPVEDKIIHEGYSGDRNNYHDIALVRLAWEVQFSDNVKPICLPTTATAQKENLNGKNLIVAGWGKTESQEGSPIKLKVDVPYKSDMYCASSYKRSNINLSNGQLCAGGDGGKGTCQGDSGGPLMKQFKDDKKNVNFYCIGVVSFGPSICAQNLRPGVYTKVESYVQWIVDKLRP